MYVGNYKIIWRCGSCGKTQDKYPGHHAGESCQAVSFRGCDGYMREAGYSYDDEKLSVIPETHYREY
ncbi:hypothetical protein LCGC14_2023350 [marine sediment metagenome]|uniref:Uncharacterized protein n=1 Tax=marine sediment metagenome TaxID=412755 RepID=A0A0F9HTX6_9ZZZZ